MVQTNKITNIDNITQNELKNRLFDYSSRYRNSNLIYYSDFNVLTLETYDRVFNSNVNYENKKLLSDVRYYTITKGTQYRPDLASQDVYNDPGYWWFLMESNDIFDIENFVIGKTLKIIPITESSI